MRIKKGLYYLAMAAGAAVVIGGNIWGSMTEVKPDPYITYKRVIYQGDTLWDVVGNTNQGREDLQELLYRVQMDNGITDPGRLQPGTEIKIRIKKH